MGKPTVFLFRLLLLASLVFPFLAVAPRAAWGASAADKATARETAGQAIELYREKRYEEALDYMNRAQALFDAPVHLLYIARCQRELGRWVEAAEGFRGLSRRQLDDAAPQQFKAAVDDAAAELKELEPKIPRLLIQVEPSDAPVEKLSIDATDVPPAVVGIERHVNPGTHTVRVEAEGYEATEKEIEVPEGETVTLTLALNEEVAVEAPVEATDEPKERSESKKPATSDAAHEPEVMIGVRFGGALPGGRIPASAARPAAVDGTIPFADTAGNGGEAELRFGLKMPLDVWIIDRWGVHLFASGGQLAGHDVELPSFPALMGITVQPSFANLGIAASVGAARDEFGGFFEAAFMAHFLTFAYSTDRMACADGSVAAADRVASGRGFRLSGGVGIPIASWGLLTPYATASADSLSSATFEPNDCFQTWYGQANVNLPENSQQLSEPATHTFFGIGVGGEGFLSL